MFSLICTRINGWVNNGETGDLRRYRAHYDVTVMQVNVVDTLLDVALLYHLDIERYWKYTWEAEMPPILFCL